MTDNSQSPEKSSGKLRLVIPKLVLKKEESQVHVKEVPNGLVTGMSSVRIECHFSPSANVSSDAVPLSAVLIKACQRSFRQLENIDELASRMTDAERKSNLLEYVLECRLVFAKLLALLEWRERFPTISSVNDCIAEINNGKAMRLTELADRMCVKHYELVRRDCPLFNARACLDRHVAGYIHNGLPSIFEEYLEEDKELDEHNKAGYISRLNRLIASRLSFLKLPEDCSFQGIGNGVVRLGILRDEVVIELSLVPGNDLVPKWFVINVIMEASFARDKVNGSLALMIQTKYNQREFEQDAILSIYSDVQLYMALFYLHQLYHQLQKMKSTVSMKIDHGDGHIKAWFFPNAEGKKMVLTVNLKGAQLQTECSWNQDLMLTPSFDCHSVGKDVIRSAYEHLCKAQFDQLDMAPYLSDLDMVSKRFSFHDFTCVIKINRNSGLYEVCFDSGQKQQCNRHVEVERILKHEASKHYVVTLEHPKTFNAFTATEKSRLGSFPKIFILIEPSICLCIGMDDLELRRYLVFVVPDTRYPSLHSISKWEAIANDEDIFNVQPLTLSNFRMTCRLIMAGIEFQVERESNAAICKNLPLHMFIDQILFTTDTTAKIILYPSYFKVTEINITCATFEECLRSVRALSTLLLVLSQHSQHQIVGTWFPLNLMVGNDTLAMDENQVILLNRLPWQHRLFNFDRDDPVIGSRLE